MKILEFLKKMLYPLSQYFLLEMIFGIILIIILVFTYIF